MAAIAHALTVRNFVCCNHVTWKQHRGTHLNFAFEIGSVSLSNAFSHEFQLNFCNTIRLHTTNSTMQFIQCHQQFVLVIINEIFYSTYWIAFNTFFCQCIQLRSNHNFPGTIFHTNKVLSCLVVFNVLHHTATLVYEKSINDAIYFTGWAFSYPQYQTAMFSSINYFVLTSIHVAISFFDFF